MLRWLLSIAGVTFLVGAGVVHGLWTNRWADDEDVIRAGDRLVQVPMVVGDWEGKDVETLESAKKLSLAAHFTRTYVHRETGKRVTLYMACGRPGPVSVHTPDVCYKANGWNLELPKTVAISDGGSSYDFFAVKLNKKSNDGSMYRRLIWGWHTDKAWKISDSPRFVFAGEKVLHKMYVERDMVHAEEPLEMDPSLDFMRALLPVLNDRVFSR